MDKIRDSYYSGVLVFILLFLRTEVIELRKRRCYYFISSLCLPKSCYFLHIRGTMRDTMSGLIHTWIKRLRDPVASSG